MKRKKFHQRSKNYASKGQSTMQKNEKTWKRDSDFDFKSKNGQKMMLYERPKMKDMIKKNQKMSIVDQLVRR